MKKLAFVFLLIFALQQNVYATDEKINGREIGLFKSGSSQCNSFIISSIPVSIEGREIFNNVLITAAHCVAPTFSAEVSFPELGLNFPVLDLVGFSAKEDIAVFSFLSSKNLSSFRVAEVDEPKSGEWMFVSFYFHSSPGMVVSGKLNFKEATPDGWIFTFAERSVWQENSYMGLSGSPVFFITGDFKFVVGFVSMVSMNCINEEESAKENTECKLLVKPLMPILNIFISL